MRRLQVLQAQQVLPEPRVRRERQEQPGPPEQQALQGLRVRLALRVPRERPERCQAFSISLCKAIVRRCEQTQFEGGYPQQTVATLRNTRTQLRLR
jgi:hypothetical protein